MFTLLFRKPQHYLSVYLHIYKIKFHYFGIFFDKNFRLSLDILVYLIYIAHISVLISRAPFKASQNLLSVFKGL